MEKQTYPAHVWKEIECDTPDHIGSKEYPKTIFYMQWLRFYFHIVETENGEFFCGYKNYPETANGVYRCNREFVEELAERIVQLGIPVTAWKYNNDPAFIDNVWHASPFWAIACHWNHVDFQFRDLCDLFTYDFACDGIKIVELVEEAIRKERNISPLKKKRIGLKGLLERYFK